MLIRDQVEQATIADIVRLRGEGWTLMRIKAVMAERGHRMSIQTVDNIAKRAQLTGAA